MIRRLVAAVGVAGMMALAGCAGDVSGTPTAGGANAEEGSEPAQEKGFEACAVLETEEVAEWIGTETMFLTSAEVLDRPDGTREASCTYFPSDTPGMLGMKLTFVADADPATYFANFERNYDEENRIPLKIGDRAEVVSLSNNGVRTKFYEVLAIKGNQGMRLFYAYSEDPDSAMPVVEQGAEKFSKVMNTAYERLPETLDFPDGKPEGACAEIDLDQLSETLSGELTTARTTRGGDGGIDCTFGGASGYVSITYLTDQTMVPGQRVKPEHVTHDDIADGARIRINEPGGGDKQGQLDARANIGDAVMAIQASYGDDVSGITEPRPEEVELVRAIVDVLGGQD